MSVIGVYTEDELMTKNPFVPFADLIKYTESRVFRKLTKLAIMGILASEALLREKIQ